MILLSFHAVFVLLQNPYRTQYREAPASIDSLVREPQAILYFSTGQERQMDNYLGEILSKMKGCNWLWHVQWIV